MANTIASALTTDTRAKELATTFLQHRLAPLAAFTRRFTTDPLKPKAMLQVPVVTVAGTAQTNATNFEDLTNFVGTTVAVPVTVAQITAGDHITNAERQGGTVLDTWLEAKLGEFSDKISDIVFALFTEANFGAPVVSSAAPAFGTSDLLALWASVAKAQTKTCILDSDFYGNFLPSNLQDFNPLTIGIPGWDHFLHHTKWDAAGAGIAGLVCSPTALALAAGLPAVSPRAAATGAEVREIVLPQLGLTVQTNRWYSNITRNDWFTFDVMFGAAVADASALKLVKRL
jgi:hypothetical protein